jgi:predicted nucleic acid-binding protein
MTNALLDANIFYSAILRDIFIRLGQADLYQARWSDDIHGEWMKNLHHKRPDISTEKLDTLRQLIDNAIPDCKVSNYEHLINLIDLPDAKDRHILAAAIIGRCDVIITFNLKDFPKEELALYGVEAQHPDNFLSNLLSLYKGAFCNVIKMTRLNLKQPPYM